MNNVRWSILATALAAAAVLTSAAPCQGASEKRIPQWIAQLGHAEKSIRTSAADQLLRLPTKDVLKPLISALKDTNWQVRAGAAGVLGRLKDKRAVEPLCLLLKDDIWTVRKEAVDALGLLKDNRAYKALVAALGDEDPVVAYAALAALRKLQSKLTDETIVAAMASPSPSVRCEVIQIVRPSRHKKAHEVFLKALTDEDASVRSVAASSIARLHIRDKKAVKPLIKLLSDKYAAARQHAARALGIIGDEAAIKPLLAIMRGDPDAYVRRDAIKSLVRLKGPTVATDLIDILPKQTEFREVILEGLRRFCDPRAGDVALKALSDGRARVRVQAVATLACLGDRRAVKPLCELLEKDPEQVVQFAAAKALGRLGDEQAVDALIAAMKHPKYQVRQAAITSLGVIGVEKARKPLRKALKSPDKRVRASAIGMLGEIGDKQSYKALLAALGEKDLVVLNAAVFAMKIMGDEKAIEPLTRVLGARLRNQPFTTERRLDRGIRYIGHYYGWSPRSGASRALARIGGQKAADALMTALRDPKDDVVRNAAIALGEMGDRRAVKPLTEIMLQHISVRAKSGAVIGLCKLGIGAAYRPGPEVLARVTTESEQLLLAEALAKHVDRGRADKLISQLKHEDAKLRRAAAQILGFAKDARAVVPLIECLDDSDKYTRRAVAQALGRLADTRATKPLTRQLEDKEVYSVPAAVVEALGQIGDRRAVGPLKAMLPRVRFSRDEVPLLVALARLEPKGHVAEVRRMLRAAQYYYDRQAAVELLAEVEGRRAIPDLKRALRDEDRSVRDAARKALKGINKTDDSLLIGPEDSGPMPKPAAGSSTGPAAVPQSLGNG